MLGESLLDLDNVQIDMPVLTPQLDQSSWRPLQIGSGRDCSNAVDPFECLASTPLPKKDDLNQQLSDLRAEMQRLQRQVHEGVKTEKDNSVNSSVHVLAQTLREEFSKLPSRFSVPAYREKKLKVFRGEGADREEVEEFIEGVKLHIEGRNWTPEEEGRFVLSHLEGEARREVRTCGVQWRTAGDLFRILRAAFGEDRTIPALFSAFAERRQGVREGIRTYFNDVYDRFQKVVKKQEEMGRTKTSEEVLVDYLLDGLRDRNLAVELKRQLSGRNLLFSQLREIAIDWETMQQPSRRTAKSACEVGAVQVEEEGKRVAELEKEVRKLKLQLEGKSLANTSSSGPAHSTQQASTGPRNVRTGPGSRFQFAADGKPICARCGKAGHVQRFCPKPRQLNGNPSV